MVDAVGWLGMILVLVGYFLVSNKKISSRSAIYHLLNLLGSLVLGVYTFLLHAWPAVILNFIWSAIAISALFSIRKGD